MSEKNFDIIIVPQIFDIIIVPQIFICISRASLVPPFTTHSNGVEKLQKHSKNDQSST